jgi:hypothetical protein
VGLDNLAGYVAEQRVVGADMAAQPVESCVHAQVSALAIPVACSMITRLFSAACYRSVSASPRRMARWDRIPIVATWRVLDPAPGRRRGPGGRWNRFIVPIEHALRLRGILLQGRHQVQGRWESASMIRPVNRFRA